MISKLMRAGDVKGAENTFENTEIRDIVTWNSLYVDNGLVRDTLMIFNKMPLKDNSIKVGDFDKAEDDGDCGGGSGSPILQLRKADRSHELAIEGLVERDVATLHWELSVKDQGKKQWPDWLIYWWATTSSEIL
ncbi:pentatricopeptide repeat-containing family protein [Striga asiatica]|uniref:Pentatricopeptide repeat-containing family protein n=1 Tax=Striga asiatica TaxID=4170 RepID=A0A5A7QK92_STRAF|nr:pentatricopeptide repeat-containing family protein [Striga asiatica]